MPTKFTESVGKMLHMTGLRKKCMNCFNSQMSTSWEYVSILEHIKKNPGCIQTDISTRLHITPAAVTQSTKKLEGVGLIEKRTEKDNLRIKRMFITDKGLESLKCGTRIFDEIDNIMFRGVSDDEVKLLGSIVDKINANLKEYVDSAVNDK